MDMVAQMMEKVNEVFDEKYLEKLARETGFIVRKRKVDAKNFLEKIIFLRLEFPSSSLEDLVCEFYKSDIVLSKQALHKKFSKAAVKFVQKVLDTLLQHTLSEQKMYISSIPFIKKVHVIDSSEIRLNKVLQDVFPQVRNQGAAIKLQSLMDAVNNQILSLDIRPSREPDQSYKAHIAYIQANDLLIGDLGYFCIESFNTIQAREGFFLSRFFKKTNLYDPHTDKQIDLRAILRKAREEKMEIPIALGTSKLHCRLVAIKLPEDAYQQRLRNLEEKHRKDPRSKVNQYNSLDRWTLFVTNLPASIEAEILLRLYSLRWQIELLFKMMKTFLSLRKVDNVNQHRALTSLYVSLIAMTLLSFVAASIVDKEISLYKASKVLIKNIRKFFDFINNKKCVITWFREILLRFALKESRLKRPSTKLSLGVCYA